LRPIHQRCCRCGDRIESMELSHERMTPRSRSSLVIEMQKLRLQLGHVYVAWTFRFACFAHQTQIQYVIDPLAAERQRGLRIEDRRLKTVSEGRIANLDPRFSIFDLRSSILHLHSSIFYGRQCEPERVGAAARTVLFIPSGSERWTHRATFELA